MLPTPDLSHLTSEDYEHVYEPAEDTFALLDALEQDAEALRKVKPFICVEIGSGSGCVSVFLQTLLGNDPLVICTDINLRALEATRRTFFQNRLKDPDLVHGSLLDPLADRLRGRVDVLLFNPPYVATDDAERAESQPDSGGGPNISSAWAGGPDGMAVTDRLLPQLPSLLGPNGRMYLVAVRENDPEGMVARMRGLGLVAETVLKRRAGREHLHILRISRREATI